jgi:hypothetical protein
MSQFVWGAEPGAGCTCSPPEEVGKTKVLPLETAGAGEGPDPEDPVPGCAGAPAELVAG